VHAELAIELHRTGDGVVVARGDLARTPYWCRWDGTTLWIVGSAATPVGEDDIALDLAVGEGVHAVVRSVAATLVYAGRGAGTRLTTRLQVGSGASLLWQPEPVIVTARARHRSVLVADVAVDGSLLADEVVVLGRSEEAAGAFASETDLRAAGASVCLTAFDTTVPGWSGPGGTDGAKVIGTRLALGTVADGAGGPPDPHTAVLRPEGGGAIATTLAPDPDRARAQLDAKLAVPPSADRRLPTAGSDADPALPVLV